MTVKYGRGVRRGYASASRHS